MQENPSMSFIVPVYNGEQYIRKSVLSLQNQTFNNIEIILVDDGSTDRSAEICKEIAESDKRVRYIHKENGGIGSARNVGLDSASGSFLAFMDQDDQVDINMAEYTLGVISAHKPDLILFKYQKRFENDLDTVELRQFPQSGLATRAEALNSFYSFRFYGMVWCGVFRASLIKNAHIRFNESYHVIDDMDFLYKTLNHVNYVYFLSKVLYSWYIHHDSESHTSIVQPTYDLIHYLNFILSNEQNVIMRLSNESKAYCVLQCVDAMHRLELADGNNENLQKQLQDIINKLMNKVEIVSLKYSFHQKLKLVLYKLRIYRYLYFIKQILRAKRSAR